MLEMIWGLWVTTTPLCIFPDSGDISADVSGGASVDFGCSPAQGCLQGDIPCDTAPAVLQECSQGWDGEEEVAQTSRIPRVLLLCLSPARLALGVIPTAGFGMQGCCSGVLVLCSFLCSALQPGTCHQCQTEAAMIRN